MRNNMSIILAVISILGSIAYNIIGFEFSVSTMLNDSTGFTIASVLIIFIVVTLLVSVGIFITSLKKVGFEGYMTIITGVIILIAAAFSFASTIAGIMFLFVAGFLFYSIFND